LQTKSLSPEEQLQYLLFTRVQIWFLSLLIMGLVLHVFEDSMVNYLFFIIYGILLGSLSRQIPSNLSPTILCTHK
jgi:hypothetical protein